MSGSKALVLICALACGPAAAQSPAPADPMAGFYGNTLSISAPYFAAKRYYAPDHTYRDTGDDGDVLGTWTIEDGKICVTPQQPDARRYCNVGLGRHTGDRWVDRDPFTNNEVRFSLEAGR